MRTEYTYLVPAGSSKRSVAEMDQPDVRIAVPRGDGSDLRLTKTLKHAELVRAESVAAITEMVRAGQVDAYAGPRVVLLKLSEQAPGSWTMGLRILSTWRWSPKGKLAVLPT
jgi:polar amino acid transport system substrate-binding protein